MLDIYFENHTKPTNKVYGKNTEIVKVVHIGVVLYRAKRLGLFGFFVRDFMSNSPRLTCCFGI